MKYPDVFVIRNTFTGLYYAGHTQWLGGTRSPIADAERNDAIELDNDDIHIDFPNGLPASWVKEKV